MFLEFEFRCEKVPSVNKTYKCNESGEVFKVIDVKRFQRDLAAYAFCKSRGIDISLLFVQKLKVELEFKVNNLRRDVDNMAKAVLDALQGVCFKNDAQIYKLTMIKAKSGDSVESVKVKIGIFDD